MLSACLTCRHSRRSVCGHAACSLDGQARAVMHVCFSFEPLKAFHDVERSHGFEVAVVSTTATNSPSGEKRGDL